MYILRTESYVGGRVLVGRLLEKLVQRVSTMGNQPSSRVSLIPQDLVISDESDSESSQEVIPEVQRSFSCWSPFLRPSSRFVSLEEETRSKTISCMGESSPLTRSGSSWLSFSELDYTAHELQFPEVTTPESDLSIPRETWIVTTAALPWFTGTAVNPLLRATYLSQRYRESPSWKSCVTLVIPWLTAEEERRTLYGPDWASKTPIDQELYIRNWLQHSAGLEIEANAETGIQICFYDAWYDEKLSSIFATQDILKDLQVGPNAVCILEEPEHLNIFSAPDVSWRQTFVHVVGVIHTNYAAYASAQYFLAGPLVSSYFRLVVRAYCDKVIKLSAILQSYSPEREVVCNVHGIRSCFLEKPAPTGNRIYFIGKLLWAKGLDRLLKLENHFYKKTGSYFPITIFGSGPDQEEIKQAYIGKNTSWIRKAESLPAEFPGRLDHAIVSSEYKIFVNPSVTEVLCTTSAEALAMGKFVILPAHDSNTFFSQFPNCLMYASKHEFCVRLQYALCHVPEPLSDGLRETLMWTAATSRLIEASSLTERDAARRDRIAVHDDRLAKTHYDLSKTGSALRQAMQGGSPISVRS